MNLQLKRTEILSSSTGSALPVVLFFSVIGMLTVFTFFLHQLSTAKPSFHSSIHLQALLTARSGIYRAFESFRTKNQLFSDTLKTISTLDSLFGKELIDIKNNDDQFSETPQKIDLFPDQSYGSCEVALVPNGCFFILESYATFMNAKSHISAKLGGKIPALPDTVLIYYNDSPWEGNPPNGKVVSFKTPPSDTSTSLISKMVSTFQSQVQLEDSILFDQPITVQSLSEINKIKDTVNGHLFIDGSHFPITWNASKKIIVLGDVQITGKTQIRNIDIVAGGEIKILDYSDIAGSLYSQSRIFFGDQSVFSGEALAEHSITIYNRAAIVNKSSLLVSGTVSTSKNSPKHSIIIADEATIDASCLALRAPGSIKTEPNTKIKGLLWAQNSVCHQGKMQGLIRALRVIDCETPGLLSTLTPTDTTAPQIINKNTLPGALSPLDNISEYPIPYLGGVPEIIEWKED